MLQLWLYRKTTPSLHLSPSFSSSNLCKLVIRCNSFGDLCRCWGERLALPPRRVVCTVLSPRTCYDSPYESPCAGYPRPVYILGRCIRVRHVGLLISILNVVEGIANHSKPIISHPGTNLYVSVSDHSNVLQERFYGSSVKRKRLYLSSSSLTKYTSVRTRSRIYSFDCCLTPWFRVIHKAAMYGGNFKT